MTTATTVSHKAILAGTTVTIITVDPETGEHIDTAATITLAEAAEDAADDALAAAGWDRTGYWTDRLGQTYANVAAA